MLGNRLREVRKQKGYTQKEIAEFLGIDRSTYTFYETGNTTPTVFSLTRLAQFYSITLDSLVGVSEPRTELTLNASFSNYVSGDNQEQKLLELYRSLPPEKKDALLEFLITLTK